MKLLSYSVAGKQSFGAVAGEGVIDLRERLSGHCATLREALAADAITEMRQIAEVTKPDHRLGEITFLPPITQPEKILCAGINYHSHAVETGRDIPKAPSMFLRLSSTLVAHNGALVRPSVSTQFNYEGELALVIGRPGRQIAEERALDHVAGYSCFVDGSVRDYQRFSVTAGKNFPNTGALGPWIVTTDEIGDPARLVLVTRLNGREVQRATTDLLIHSVARIVSFCSQFTALAPGDVIATGTPEGVGQSRRPPLWLKAGDLLEVEISRVGALRSRVVDGT